MPSKESIFISYRRTDSQDVVGRIDDYLSHHFGREHVFLDRNAIDYGDAFPKRLKQAIQDSKVVLVVMGSTWLSVKDKQGRPRLASPDDWVRQEIALALALELYVIPILLDDTVMPAPGALPQDIQTLAERNAIDLITRRSANLFTALMKEITDLIERKVPALKPAPPITLEPFEFEVVTVQLQSGLFGKKVSRQSQKRRAQQYIERLGHHSFDMVAIPGGTFMMSAPASEESSGSDERPQHRVTVSPFLMGKYPVTQELWRTVAGLQIVAQELELNPSHFKGDQRPVERVSWLEAEEFCARLSRQTGRTYRLPSEAEWEYACRAGTETPFHFGATITPDLVNYDGNYTYGDAPKGAYREQTTDVGSFPANAFGLSDMHGNVWEWCADQWYGSYDNKPEALKQNGAIAWTEETTKMTPKADETTYRLLRGGSWDNLPGYCRSASRFRRTRDYRYHYFGFRLVSPAPSTL